MIAATRRWLRRHSTGLAVGFGVIGVGYVASQYVLSKLAEARERMSSDRIAKENLRRRFEQNQEDCTFTVLALLPTATDNVLEAVPVENIADELQQRKAARLARSGMSSELGTPEMSSGPGSAVDDDGRSLRSTQSEGYVHASQMGEPRSRKTNAQLWNELKIKSITRTFTLVYTLALLTLLTRIQLNLLGRRNYLSSVISLASHPPHDSAISLENHDEDVAFEQEFGNDFETNRRYLTFSWWLLHRGWKDVMQKVETAVRECFGSLNPREDITMEKLSELMLAVRKQVEGGTEEERCSNKWLPYLLPAPSEELFVLQESGMASSSASSSHSNTSPPPARPGTSAIQPESIAPPLRRLLDETSDLIDSPTFTHVLTRLLDASFSHLIDTKLSTQAFSSETLQTATSEPASESRVQEMPDPATVRTKLATVLAVMTRQAHSIGHGVPNEYLQAMEQVREMEAFAAVVYSSNFEFETERVHEPVVETKGAEGRSEGSGMGDRNEGGDMEASGEMIGAESGFESAWGKAVATAVEKTEGERAFVTGVDAASSAS